MKTEKSDGRRSDIDARKSGTQIWEAVHTGSGCPFSVDSTAVFGAGSIGGLFSGFDS